MAVVDAGAPRDPHAHPDGHGHDHDHGHPHPAASRSTGGLGRRATLAAVAGVSTLTGYVFLVDPDQGGAYPLCPSKLLLGMDCPFCGGLRGTNALLHGRVAEALDHNVLLPGLLATIAVMLGLGALKLIGRPLRIPPVPRWLQVAAVVLLGAFMVTRNLPIDSLEYLASEA
jgi:Protein of unknown function (DUF2752)